ncbi:synaptotagmin-2 [Conger conger]|uniref:synaptotagmin-2 n=1 Tax=Conger conger TaxID=82655 RepID=UPI002A59B126|nr:synaptotagmin-2 [Conger conger]
MNFPSTLQLSIQVRMPFPDDIKYSILGISVLLLAVAVIILVWQVYRYYTLTPASQRLASPSLSGSPPPGWPLQAQGSLHFSLLYDRPRAQLLLRVLGARGLRGAQERGAGHSLARGRDPLVIVRVMWAGPKDTPTSPPLYCVLSEWQSPTVTDSTNPASGDEFSCPLPEKEIPHTTVRLEVRDVNKHSRQGILGEVRADLGGMNLGDPLEIQQDLQLLRKDPVGEVLLSLKYLPTSQRLEVGLLKIRTLSQSPSKHKSLYARTSVVCNRRNLRHQKTTMKTRWEVTVFDEVMTFALPDPQVTECSIVVSVYEVAEGKRSPKRLIGQVNLRKGRKAEDEHWSLMMRSLRQPIAKWHLLLI